MNLISKQIDPLFKDRVYDNLNFGALSDIIVSIANTVSKKTEKNKKSKQRDLNRGKFGGFF